MVGVHGGREFKGNPCRGIKAMFQTYPGGVEGGWGQIEARPCYTLPRPPSMCLTQACATPTQAYVLTYPPTLHTSCFFCSCSPQRVITEK